MYKFPFSVILRKSKEDVDKAMEELEEHSKSFDKKIKSIMEGL